MIYTQTIIKYLRIFCNTLRELILALFFVFMKNEYKYKGMKQNGSELKYEALRGILVLCAPY